MLKNKVISSFVGLSTVNVLNILIPIITIPYLSRVLTPEGYGVFLLYSTVYVLAFIIIDYSSNIVGVREIAIASDKRQRQNIYERTQSVRLFFCMIAIIMSVIYLSIVQRQQVDWWFLTSNVVMATIGYYLTALWFHQGIQDLVAIAVVSFLVRIIQLTVLFTLVHSVNDLSLAIFSNSIIFLITGLFSLIYRFYKNGTREKVNYFYFVFDIKRGFNSFIGDFSPNLYSNLPPLLIGTLTSPALFAAYSLSMRLINVAGSFQLMLAKAMYPSVARGEFTFKWVLLINVFVGLIPFFILYFFSDSIIHLFLGPGYANTGNYMVILAPSIIFISILYSLTYGYFLPKKRDREFKNVSLFVSIISALIGYYLIYDVGVYGAIIMFVLARFLFTLLYGSFYIRLESKRTK